MKKFAILVASAAVLGVSALSAMAGGIGGGFGGGGDQGIKIDVYGANKAPIVAGQPVGKIGVGHVGVDLDVSNTAVAVTSDITVEGAKVDSIDVGGKNGGIVVAVQAIKSIGADNVGGSVNVKNLAAGVASSISIKD